MDYLQFMNSKTLFKVRGARGRVGAWAHGRRQRSQPGTSGSQFQRKDPVGKNRLPVMVHINYHPDKARPLFGTFLRSAALIRVCAAVGAHEGGHTPLGRRRHQGA